MSALRCFNVARRVNLNDAMEVSLPAKLDLADVIFSTRRMVPRGAVMGIKGGFDPSPRKVTLP